MVQDLAKFKEVKSPVPHIELGKRSIKIGGVECSDQVSGWYIESNGLDTTIIINRYMIDPNSGKPVGDSVGPIIIAFRYKNAPITFVDDGVRVMEAKPTMRIQKP